MTWEELTKNGALLQCQCSGCKRTPMVDPARIAMAPFYSTEEALAKLKCRQCGTNTISLIAVIRRRIGADA